MVKKGFIGAIVLAVVLFGGVILGLMCTERIPAGYVGVVYNMNPPFFMRYRCEQMGVNCVPLLWSGFVPENDDPGEWVKGVAECYYDGADPIGKSHVREGVVCRIVNRPKFTAYKHKNFAFKVLEGIVKEVASAPDMEEAQEVTEAA